MKGSTIKIIAGGVLLLNVGIVASDVAEAAGDAVTYEASEMLPFSASATMSAQLLWDSAWSVEKTATQYQFVRISDDSL